MHLSIKYHDLLNFPNFVNNLMEEITRRVILCEEIVNNITAWLFSSLWYSTNKDCKVAWIWCWTCKVKEPQPGNVLILLNELGKKNKSSKSIPAMRRQSIPSTQMGNELTMYRRMQATPEIMYRATQWTQSLQGNQNIKWTSVESCTLFYCTMFITQVLNKWTSMEAR